MPARSQTSPPGRTRRWRLAVRVVSVSRGSATMSVPPRFVNSVKKSLALCPRLEMRGFVPSRSSVRAFGWSGCRKVAGDASNIHWSSSECCVFSWANAQNHRREPYARKKPRAQGPSPWFACPPTPTTA
jgi:hypothetical protein